MGAAGPPGPPGPAGAQGAVGAQGPSGTLAIDTGNSTVISQNLANNVSFGNTLTTDLAKSDIFTHSLGNLLMTQAPFVKALSQELASDPDPVGSISGHVADLLLNNTNYDGTFQAILQQYATKQQGYMWCANGDKTCNTKPMVTQPASGVSAGTFTITGNTDILGTAYINGDTTIHNGNLFMDTDNYIYLNGVDGHSALTHKGESSIKDIPDYFTVGNPKSTVDGPFLGGRGGGVLGTMTGSGVVYNGGNSATPTIQDAFRWDQFGNAAVYGNLSAVGGIHLGVGATTANTINYKVGNTNGMNFYGSPSDTNPFQIYKSGNILHFDGYGRGDIMTLDKTGRVNINPGDNAANLQGSLNIGNWQIIEDKDGNLVFNRYGNDNQNKSFKLAKNGNEIVVGESLIGSDPGGQVYISKSGGGAGFVRINNGNVNAEGGGNFTGNVSVNELAIGKYGDGTWLVRRTAGNNDLHFSRADGVNNWNDKMNVNSDGTAVVGKDLMVHGNVTSEGGVHGSTAQEVRIQQKAGNAIGIGDNGYSYYKGGFGWITTH
jgi:hypothetical protein